MARKRKTRRRGSHNPTPQKVAAIVVGSLGAIALGSFVVYAVRSSRRAGLPPAVKQSLPPRANGMPSPDPIAPAKVPATVTTAASALAPVTPPSTPSSPAPTSQADDWSTYGWYTYKGEAPQKMWIRVDLAKNWFDMLENFKFDLAKKIYSFRGNGMRWVVIMGEDTPMATASLKKTTGVRCSMELGEDHSCAKAHSHALLRDMPDHAVMKSFLSEWILPTFGQQAARQAADWIDIAYGG